MVRRLHLLPANVLQDLFAQQVGVTLTGSRKIDDLIGDGLFDEIVGAFGPHGDADHFECDDAWTEPSVMVEL